MSSGNIGPAKGDHHIGTFEGPGLYLLTGENSAGKSHHLRVLGRAGEGNLLSSTACISAGETDAYFRLGAYEVVFRTSPDGKPQPPEISGSYDLPVVSSLPAPIQTLLTGDHIKGDDARMVRRLKALLTYMPVPASPEVVARLIDGAKPFINASDKIRADWAELFATMDFGKKSREGSALGPAELADWLADQKGDAHEIHVLLVRKLNALGLTAEEMAAHLKTQAAGKKESARTALEAAWDTLGEGGAMPTTFAHELEAADSAEADPAEKKTILDRLMGDHERHLRATKEREQMADSHSCTKPVVSKSKLDAVSVLVREMEESAQNSSSELDLAKGDFAEQVLESASADLRQRMGDEMERAASGQELSLQALHIKFDDFVEKLSFHQGHVARIRHITEQTEAARKTLLDRTHEKSREESAYLESIKSLERWNVTNELINVEIEPGPTEEEIESAEVDYRKAARAAGLRLGGDRYRSERSAYNSLHAAHAEMVVSARGYRTAAQKAPVCFGNAVTDFLDIPWLSIHQGHIFLHFKEQEVGSPLASERKGSHARNIDDEDAISTAELSDAMIRLLLERRKGGLVILPWEMIAAMSDTRVLELDAAICESATHVLSERPKRAGDSEDLLLERVATSPAFRKPPAVVDTNP